jgi:hypothetical protein
MAHLLSRLGEDTSRFGSAATCTLVGYDAMDLLARFELAQLRLQSIAILHEHCLQIVQRVEQLHCLDAKMDAGLNARALLRN